MNQKIKAIIFDIGGVLQLGEKRSHGVHNEIFEKIGISSDQYFDSIDSTYVKSVEGKISEHESISSLAKNLGVTNRKLRGLFIKAYKKHFTLNKELLKFAIEKKKQGYKIAILSDQWWVSKKVLVIKKFYHFFNPVIISCDVGMRKPNPEIYKLVLKKLHVLPKESVFIDNQKWNIVPAKKLGMKTILFRNNKQAIKELEKLLK
jgi:epoxide hydrolase-like predicted phosphatase